MTLTTAYLCMALNIYFESRGEPELGQKLVAQATLNRADSVSGVCNAVLAPSQFSWTRRYVAKRNLKPNVRPQAGDESWNKSQHIADLALQGRLSLQQKWHNVTHFHSTAVRPSWASNKNMQYLGRIGNHCFYSDKSISQR